MRHFWLLICLVGGSLVSSAPIGFAAPEESDVTESANSPCGVCPDSLPVCNGTSCGPCQADVQCGTGKICDTAFGQCIERPNLEYGGGCSTLPNQGQKGNGPLLFLLLGGLGIFFCAVRKGSGKTGSRHAHRLSHLGLFTWLFVLILITGLHFSARAQTSPGPSGPGPMIFNAQTRFP